MYIDLDICAGKQDKTLRKNIDYNAAWSEDTVKVIHICVPAAQKQSSVTQVYL